MNQDAAPRIQCRFNERISGIKMSKKICILDVIDLNV